MSRPGTELALIPSGTSSWWWTSGWAHPGRSSARSGFRASRSRSRFRETPHSPEFANPLIAAEELLVAIDLSEPSNPVTLGRIAIARAMSDVAVHGSVAYVTSLSEGLVLVDVSDPSEMRRLSSIPSIKWADSVVARGQHAYLGTWQGLIIVDALHPS